MPPISRRSLLAAGAFAVGGLAAPRRAGADDVAYRVVDENAFGGQTRRLKLYRGSRYLAALIFPTDYPTHFRLKPELYPVCTPSGVPVTDTHQFSFIHHQSILCGHGKVLTADGRRLDFYRQLPFPDRAREDKFHADYNLYQLGPSGMQRIVAAQWSSEPHIRIHLELAWETRAPGRERGEAILHELRQLDVSVQGSATVIDVCSRLQPASSGGITLAADRHSYCGVRVSDLIDVEDGGTLRDSLGRVNLDGNYWDAQGERQAPLWTDCTGTIAGRTAGMTLMGHPKNVRNDFYVRHWGLMIVSPTLGHDVQITPTAPLQFAARYAAHDGQLSDEQAGELYEDFSRRELPA